MNSFSIRRRAKFRIWLMLPVGRMGHCYSQSTSGNHLRVLLLQSLKGTRTNSCCHWRQRIINLNSWAWAGKGGLNFWQGRNSQFIHNYSVSWRKAASSNTEANSDLTMGRVNEHDVSKIWLSLSIKPCAGQCSSHGSHMAREHFECGHSKSRSATSVKYTLDFEDKIPKSKMK